MINIYVHFPFSTFLGSFFTLVVFLSDVKMCLIILDTSREKAILTYNFKM